MRALRRPGRASGERYDPAVSTIEVVQGNIIRQVVDAIVTAANSSLQGGSGVDGAIHRAAGPQLALAGRDLAPCRPGDARATPAFALDPPIRYVIHTVGPVWRGGDHGESDVLASCYRRCLEVADEHGAGSIAFPAISTGIYGFPPEQAARIAVDTVRATQSAVGLVRLVAFDQRMHDRSRLRLPVRFRLLTVLGKRTGYSGVQPSSLMPRAAISRRTCPRICLPTRRRLGWPLERCHSSAVWSA